MLPRRQLLWQLYVPYLVVTLLSLFAVTWYATTSLRRFYHEQATSDLRIRARLVSDQISPHLETLNASSIQETCQVLGEEALARVTVILPDGSVIADSDEDPSRMDNHGDRPEVCEALAGKTGKSIRFSHTLQVDMLYFAMPLESNGRVVAVVRTAMPLTALAQGISFLYWRVSITGLVVALSAALLSLAISRRIARPLEEMKRGAERFARGDFAHQLEVAGAEELGALSEAMNQMAVQLEDRLRTVVRQRNELEAVFSSMVEGVLAVDKEERLIGINQAAARLMNLDSDKVMGYPIKEVVTNTDLLRLISSSLSSDEPVEGDVILGDPDPRFLQVHGTILRDARGTAIGALVVLEDVTRIRRLEDIRRDFVANVSHELRTPITSIKGFVETLLDGAMEDSQDTRRFLEIISKQSDRLNAIINDLLSLSQIERDEEREAIQVEDMNLRDVLQIVVQTYETSAAAKRISIHLKCADDILIKANPLLIEQAVVNLVDNAIKYSEEGKDIHVEALRSGDDVRIQVSDQGCGIAKEHLPRLFERFYRVDKARSRKMGGTGLGLAIVKHIARAHGGRVMVESTPGQGSVFTISLPG